MLEWLKTILGEAYTEEIDKKVSEEIGKGFVAKADFNTTKTELTQARATIKERDTQLEGLKKSTGDTEALQKQITDLQTANAQKDKDHAAEIQKIKMDAAVDKALTDAHAKNTTAAKALLADFLAKAELGEDGTVKGFADELKKLTEGEGTAFLFDKDTTSTTQISGASPVGGSVPPDPKAAGFESRLAEARKNNDMVAAVNIKQEAATQGIILM